MSFKRLPFNAPAQQILFIKTAQKLTRLRGYFRTADLQRDRSRSHHEDNMSRLANVRRDALFAGVTGVSTAANTTEVSGVILMSAGLYQLTPLKEFCLSKCRTPTDFVVTSSAEGPSGGFYMGLIHGLYCLGSYWMLFVILFPLGMSIAAMTAVTLVILGRENTASTAGP